jgi:multimeric flavodoxin WrbA
MKIVLVNGTNYKGITYHYAREIADGIGGDITEFFLPKDFGDFCLGCGNCLYKGEALCPHHAKLETITKAMDEADVLIFASPTFVYHVSGAMKAFLDHYAYRWMLHRPNEAYFKKAAIAVSTCAGAGAKSACNDMTDSFFYWGIAKIFEFSLVAAATSLDKMTSAKQKKGEAKVKEIVNEVHHCKNPQPSLKTKAFFDLSKEIHKKSIKIWPEVDLIYWSERGWDKSARPWKKEGKHHE